MFRDGQWYTAVIDDVRADGTVLVTWHDNDRRDRIKPLFEIRKIRVFPAGGSEQKKKYSVSKRKVAGGATNPRIACDDCRKKRIRCVHMAAAAIALGVSIKNTQKHAKDQNARNGSTIGGSGIGDVGKSAPLTAQVEIM
jgi:hypothetical protein